MVGAKRSNIGISIFKKEKPLASVVETIYVKKFTNIICEMRSVHVYSAFDAVITSRVADTWLAVTSRARNAVDTMKSAVTK